MTSTSITVTDPSHVAQARRTATACARAVGFTESDVGRVALVATEAASNVLKHGTAGVILVAAAPSGQAVATAVDVLAIDHGPGMSNVDACLVDGYSTAGSPGTGLGALRRVSSHFDCYSRSGVGTVLLARVAPERAPRAPARAVAGAVAVPYPGETASGDQWAIAFDRLTATIMVSDGLGHGQSAAEASITATAVFRAQPNAAPAELVTAMHDALRHTRGAAIAVARLEPETARVRYCGVGNISGRIVSGEQIRHLVSHNGTAGHDVRRIQEFTYDWPADGVLVLHSDGIAGRWRLHDYSGLAVRHPSVIAAVLYRDFCRGRDDATVVVLQPSRVS